MKNVQKIDLGLTGYDELFANDEERKVNKLPRIFDIPISEIDDFPDHPFKVKIDEDNEGMKFHLYGQSRGRNGSYSTNYQLTGRELMTPDEVRMLDNQYALLFIRGERPVQDFKYDILHHPNVRETTDGGAQAFTHGEDTRSIAAMSFVFDPMEVEKAQKFEPQLHDFELLSEEELQEKFDKKEKEEHEKHHS